MTRKKQVDDGTRALEHSNRAEWERLFTVGPLATAIRNLDLCEIDLISGKKKVFLGGVDVRGGAVGVIQKLYGTGLD